MSSQPESWTVEHFSLNNAAGPGQEDVPALLRAVADAVERYGTVSVQDLGLHRHHEITEHGKWPSITVYFSRSSAQLVPPT